jgi:hypothetical protein
MVIDVDMHVLCMFCCDIASAYSRDQTSRHQMTIKGNRNEFERADLAVVADQFGIRNASVILPLDKRHHEP